MTQEAIFLPLLAMIALTFATALWMLALRIQAVRSGQLPAGYFKLNRGGKEPEQLARVAQHFHNLLELPPLFYVALVVIFVLQRVDPTYLTLAWLYVLFRLLHGIVHTTYNNVLHRLSWFLLSVAMLAALWVRIGAQLLGGT
jgi:hypothetical protein